MRTVACAEVMGKPRVLQLTGWSDGPLRRIAQVFDGQVEILSVDLPMPGVGRTGFLWMKNPFIFATIGYIVCLPFIAKIMLEYFSPIVTLSLLLPCSVGIFRCLLGATIYYAIRQGIKITADNIRRFDPDIVVGFSWGGGILAWLLADGQWKGPALLLSPTHYRMAQTAFLKAPRIRADESSSVAAQSGGRVKILYAPRDPFLPRAQIELFRIDGCGAELIDDDHTLCETKSLRVICDRFRELLESRGRTSTHSSEHAQDLHRPSRI